MPSVLYNPEFDVIVECSNRIFESPTFTWSDENPKSYDQALKMQPLFKVDRQYDVINNLDWIYVGEL